MQLITFISAAAATIATVSADAANRNAVALNAGCNTKLPYARIINRCDYPVNLWSVLKGDGCPTDQMVTLKTGEVYTENYITAKQSGDGRGVSIKISKTNQCKGVDITQLEYFLDNRDTTPEQFQLNYLDVSYVDCVSDCPTKKEGYYFQVGTAAARAAKATTDNSWCPVLSCSDPVSCAKMSYILPDDVQTKTCDLQSSMDFYMCGSQPPSSDDTASQPPANSSTQAASSSPMASSTVKASSSADAYKVNIAAVTPAAQAKDNVKSPKVKTTVVYVTAYEYVNAKRHEHAHAHARRHRPFHA